ncbi:AAA family ATPase [Arthrobacter sp. ATA002]|nr:AAA family ATPase [Arthrobacter sp. ATA002]
MRPSSLLILDEPEQRLDPVMRERLGERITAYADAGGTVLLVTHDPALLLATAGRCLVIDDDVRDIEPERAASEIAGR